MPHSRLTVALFFILVSSLVACGSVATPVPNAETLEAQQPHDAEHVDTEVEDEPSALADSSSQTEAEEVTIEPTEVPPTATPTMEPPTPTPTEIPPTETPTEEPTAAEAPMSSDQVAQLVNLLGDPAQGETIFNTMYTTSIGDWACSTCHMVDIPDSAIGPSLLGISQRAGTRVVGQVAERYIWNSIINPQEYIVEGFAEGLQMPPNYREIFSDDQLYHLVAYLLTTNE